MADQPAWMATSASPGRQGAASAAPGAPTQAAASAPAPAGTPPPEGKFIRGTMHFVNVGLTVMMAASAVFGLDQITNVKIAAFFLAVYLLIFAVAFFVYEMVAIAPSCRAPDAIMRKNFGFFYGPKGRGFYLIFTGFLNFGLPGNFSLATGIVVISWGIICILLYMKWPAWFDWEKQR